MSKIYEALKKAEREREKAAVVMAQDEVRQPSDLQSPSRSIGSESLLLPVAAEEYQKMFNLIKSASSDREIKTILTLSSVHGEGTSSVASQLSRSLVQSGREKVLLVDANLRNPVLHELFMLERENGFVELMEGRISASEAIKETKFPGLFVVTSGEPTQDPPHLLGSPHLKEVLAEWRGSFSRVLFDSSPVLAYADAVILGRLLDGVVLVIQAGKTRWEVIQKAQDTLNNAKVSILGVILNKRQYVIPKRVYKRL